MGNEYSTLPLHRSLITDHASPNCGVDVGQKGHQVEIADPNDKPRDASRVTRNGFFSIPHSQEGFREFFSRIERHRRGFVFRWRWPWRARAATPAPWTG